MVVLGNRGLESAEANGDTRTLSLHHLHTDENLTITYKRDGRYDEEALKKLDHFLRDWRKDESVHMDPRLFDVIWEVSREFGKDRTIQVVCGYRSPATNAMLRRRSGGVAEFSQHTLGKAMDFYIQGASLEEIREAGMRLQRGGVGYYPTSGSPFVHIDVGNVRHWPRMTHEQLARVFPNGRTVHVPSDGQPLSGYAQALAEIQKRGSSPSQMSLAAAQSAGVDTAAAGTARVRTILASSARVGEDGEDSAASVAASRSYSLASLPGPSADSERTASSTARSRRIAGPEADRDAGRAAPAAVRRDPWATAGLGEAPRPPAGLPHAPLTTPDSNPALAPWPFRDADNDRVPLDMVLAYAAVPGNSSDAPPAMAIVDREPARGSSAATTRNPGLREHVVHDSNAAGAGQDTHQTAASANAPVVVNVIVAKAEPGMRYDDPWLRAAILAPRLYESMTAMHQGERDLTELRSLMRKPATAIAMSFSTEPYPGIKATSFSGEAIAQLTTITFSQKTAWLPQ